MHLCAAVAQELLKVSSSTFQYVSVLLRSQNARNFTHVFKMADKPFRIDPCVHNISVCNTVGVNPCNSEILYLTFPILNLDTSIVANRERLKNLTTEQKTSLVPD